MIQHLDPSCTPSDTSGSHCPVLIGVALAIREDKFLFLWLRQVLLLVH